MSAAVTHRRGIREHGLPYPIPRPRGSFSFGCEHALPQWWQYEGQHGYAATPESAGTTASSLSVLRFLGAASFVGTRTRVASDWSGRAGGRRHGAEPPQRLEPVTARACRCRPGVARAGARGQAGRQGSRERSELGPRWARPPLAYHLLLISFLRATWAAGTRALVGTVRRRGQSVLVPCAKLHRSSQDVDSCRCRRRVDMAIGEGNPGALGPSTGPREDLWTSGVIHYTVCAMPSLNLLNFRKLIVHNQLLPSQWVKRKRENHLIKK
jgi:hypothetical protein